MNLSRQFTRREKILLVILAVLLLFALYFFAVHRPVVNAMERIQSESENVSTQITILQAKEARMQAMRKELDEILAQPNVVEIPRYDNLDQVAAFLNAVLLSADEYSLSFDGTASDDDAGIVRRGMSLTFTCASYELAHTMVQQLQESPYRCQISTLSIEPLTKRGSRSDAPPPLTSGEVSVSLRGTFFESRKN